MASMHYSNFMKFIVQTEQSLMFAIRGVRTYTDYEKKWLGNFFQFD